MPKVRSTQSDRSMAATMKRATSSIAMNAWRELGAPGTTATPRSIIEPTRRTKWRETRTAATGCRPPPRAVGSCSPHQSEVVVHKEGTAEDRVGDTAVADLGLNQPLHPEGRDATFIGLLDRHRNEYDAL